jgi:hypothetical protein
MALDTEAKRWSMLQMAGGPSRVPFINPTGSNLDSIEERVTNLNLYGGLTSVATVFTSAVGVSDAMYDILGDLGYTGSLAGRLVKYFKANGATSDSLQTAEYQFLVARGISGGSIADMWIKYFASRGFENTLL